MSGSLTLELANDGRLEKAYEYETPEYRKVFDFKKYRLGIHGVGLWTKVEVKDVACTDKCVVDTQIYAKLTPLDGVTL